MCWTTKYLHVSYLFRLDYQLRKKLRNAIRLKCAAHFKNMSATLGNIMFVQCFVGLIVRYRKAIFLPLLAVNFVTFFLFFSLYGFLCDRKHKLIIEKKNEDLHKIVRGTCPFINVTPPQRLPCMAWLLSYNNIVNTY